MGEYSVVPRVRPLSYAKIESMTQWLIRRHYPQLLQEPGAFPIDDLLEFVLPIDYEIDVWPSTGLPVGVEGVTVPAVDGGRTCIHIAEEVFEGIDDGDGRCRFTGAHEAGHGLLHAKQIEHALVSGTFAGLHRDSTVETFRHPEWQANAFAGALLMPAPAVIVALADCGRNVPRLTATFQVSALAMNRRLEVLERQRKI